MRRVPIRLKLAAALSIPLLALGVVTVLEVLKSADEVAEIRSQTDLAEAAIGPSGLVSALQNERTWPAVDLVGQTAVVDMPVEGYDDTRAATDAALAEFEQLIASKDSSIREAFRDPLEQLAQIDQLRADIDANVAAVNPRTIENNFAFSHEVFSRYSELAQPFFDATTRISLAIDDPELRQGTELADTATRQIEEMSLLLNGVMGDAMGPGGIDTTAEIASSSVRLTRLENNADVLQNGSGPYAAISAETFPEGLTERVITNVREGVNNNNLDLMAVFADVNVPKDEGYIAMQEAINAEVNARRDSLNSTAEARQRWFIALAVLVLSTAVVLTWLVSRSITKPLRSLTREAKEMAERRLPEAVIDILETPLGDDVVMPQVTPVRLNTRDEVSDVSDALNTVQDTALDLAVEQAVLRRNIADSFVNLGRRNQNLLGRQLDFITELETNETDADTLANLFRLDHLATRMRRNAESLLVLAGIEPPRKWAAPVRLTDVIRAALGEVEDYQRVTVRGVEPATILGSAAADLAHLMAELIENALVFSPPDQTVDIRGRNRPDGYTLAIIDSGLGMPASDIAAANRRLAGAESFTIAPSKYLGHYVAGNLAARHDIHVHLDNSPGNGITATIDIPPTLLTTDTALPQADEPHAAREVWPPAPSTNEVPSGPAPLPSRRPVGPPAALPQAGGDPAYTQLPQPDPTRPVAFPRADFGDTGRVPAYRDDNPAAWPDPAPAGGPDVGAEPPWFSAPAPTAEAGPAPLGGGLARRQPADDAAAESRRTPSGLVKRTPRVVDTGEIQAVGLSADPDLLTSLSRFGNPGQQVTGTAPATPHRPGPAPQAPVPPADGAPPLPSRQQQPPSAPVHPAPQPLRDDSPFAAPRPAAGPGPGSGPGAGTGFGGLAAGLSGLSPFQGSSPGARDTGAAAGPDAGSGSTGGLPRRVRGAQLPTTKPVQLRRSGRPADPGPAPAPAAPGGSPFGAAPPASSFPSPPPTPAAPAGTPGKQSADAVYSFLSSFTAGVQRGLDDSRPNGQPPA